MAWNFERSVNQNAFGHFTADESTWPKCERALSYSLGVVKVNVGDTPIAVMQPYFFPYIGYFQLIQASSLFVLRDEAQFSKGGWINRNRILRSCTTEFLTLELKKDSDYAPILNRRVAETFNRSDKVKQVDFAYAKAPFRDVVTSLLEATLSVNSRYLVDILENGLYETSRFLGLSTPIVRASSMDLQPESRGVSRVLEICDRAGASTYINAPGGRHLYRRADFRRHGLDLRFIESRVAPYEQGACEFTPNLSIIDYLAWVGPVSTRQAVLHDYELSCD